MKCFILMLSLSVLASCGNKKRPAPQASCDGVICTMVMAMVTVEVRDANGNAVTLDDAYTLVSKSGQRIPSQQQMGNGRYNVLDDSYQKQLANKTDEFRFVGMKNGAKVVDETYTISADCCHVKKVSGKDLVQIP